MFGSDSAAAVWKGISNHTHGKIMRFTFLAATNASLLETQKMFSRQLSAPSQVLLLYNPPPPARLGSASQ